MSDMPETRFVRIADYHIAYQVFGEGPPDLLFIRGNRSHLELQWEEPKFAGFLRALAGFGRVIVYDDRGTGLSDPFTAGSYPSHEERAEDALAVLDAAGSREAVVIGAGPVTRPVLLAAAHPERVMALVLCDPVVSWTKTADHPFGLTEEERRPLRGTVDFFEKVYLAPHEVAVWFERYSRLSIGRGPGREIARAAYEADKSSLLASVHVSTLVVELLDAWQPGRGRYTAERIPGARLVDLPGRVFGGWRFDDPEAVAGVIEEFVTGERRPPPTDRVLATIMFTDFVDSTSKAASLGDRRWRSVLDSVDAFVERQIDRFGGSLVKSTGDGHLATFDSPSRGVLCACACRDGAARFELEVRGGVHTGEIELRGEDIGGLAVHIARRVCDAAAPGEVLVSASVPPLIAGSGVAFEARGERELKGVPDLWQLYAVKS